MGGIGGLASVFAELYRLSASQTALLVAIPVLLGSLARLPMGMLTDRFGGRAIFAGLMGLSAVAAWLIPLTSSYETLVAGAFFLGLAGRPSRSAPPLSRAGASRAAGNGSRPLRAGTLGQSLAVFGGPMPAAAFGWPSVFRGVAAALLAWTVVYALLARNPSRPASPAGVGAMVALLKREPTAWLLGAFYF